MRDKEQARRTLAEAIHAARRIEDEEEKAESLRNVADAEAKAGLAQQARETLVEARGVARRMPARDLTQNLTGREHELDDGKASDAKTWLLSRIATWQAGEGFLADALATAADIEDPHARALVLCEIAATQAKAEKQR
jgi:hypothetical protein